jgi:DNA polymerase-3 subunit beta
MIIFKASQEAILSHLQQIAGIVEKRHTVPVLANVLIHKQGEQSVWTTSDLEIQMRHQAALGGDEVEQYSITVAVRKLIDILRTLPAEQVVSLEDKEQKLLLRAGKSRFTLQSLPAQDFPLVQEASSYSAPITLPQKELKKLLHQVAFSMAVQDIRHYLNGLLLQIDGKKLAIVATDGHRLAYTETTLEQELPKQDIILPRKTVLELLRLLSDDENAMMELALASNQARFRLGSLEFISKLVEGKFPDYNRVIPQNHQHSLQLSRTALQASLQRTAIMMSDKFKGVRLNLEPGLLRVSSNNNEQEEAIDELDVDYTGPAMEIGFNVTYLQDVLANTNQDMVHFALQDGGSSSLITIPGVEGFKYVVMPMRI